VEFSAGRSPDTGQRKNDFAIRQAARLQLKREPLVGTAASESDMTSAIKGIPALRESVCGLMRIVTHVKKRGKKKPPITEFRLAFVGTCWCIVADKYLVTAHHTLNGGKARDPADHFYAFAVPGNGPKAFHFPVVGFHLEDQATDLAVFEVGPPPATGQHIPEVPVTFGRPADGEPVLTYGFPAPAIAGANLAPDGKFLGGGQFFLKGHANEGIVAAQYEVDTAWHYEFNIGWHHGESGGPIARLEPCAVFAVMQHYRNIQSPHGVVAGPHVGRSLEVIQSTLTNLGARVL
jgi:hypothetical protein